MKMNRRTMLAASTAAVGTVCCTDGYAAPQKPAAKVPEEAVILTAIVRAKPGEEAAVKKALLSMVAPTRREKGCLCYNLHQSKKDPTQFLFYEQWASQAALDAHGQSPHMKALGPQLRGKTVKGGGVTFYQLLGD